MDDELKSCRYEVNRCIRCQGISDAVGPYGTNIALNFVEPEVPVEVMFVAESPPPNTANFFYHNEPSNTKFRDRLFKLIRLAGLMPVASVREFNARGYYLADVIHCGWNKDRTNVRQPTPRQLGEIMSNCLEYLEVQIRALRPRAVVAMGRLAQKGVGTARIQHILAEVGVPKTRIVEIPFILTAPVGTSVLVEKLSVLSSMGKSLGEDDRRLNQGIN